VKSLSLVVFILFLVSGTAYSQSCLPEGIIFTTQEQIDNFQTTYPGCTEIEGDVEISGNNITNLNGLNVLTAFWGGLRIDNNNLLINLSGLDNVTSIGGYLSITANNALPSLTGLKNLISIGESLSINSNDTLTSLAGLNNVTSIGGFLSFYNNAALTSLAGMDNVTSIGMDLSFANNAALTSLTGLENVTSIGRNLDIYFNHSLTSLTGLENVTSIEGHLYIEDNPALTSLTSLDNVTSIGGYLFILDNASLTSLAGLDNVTSIGEDLWIEENAALTSLSGLDNIEAGSISDLVIYDNISLSTCEVQSVCDYLLSPGGTIEIHDNAPGCNSPEEVEDACELSVGSLNPDVEISIFPNPANMELNISTSDGTIKEVVIYNLTGQQVLNEKGSVKNVDISKLQPGLYIIEVVSGHSKFRDKFISK